MASKLSSTIIPAFVGAVTAAAITTSLADDSSAGDATPDGRRAARTEPAAAPSAPGDVATLLTRAKLQRIQQIEARRETDRLDEEVPPDPLETGEVTLDAYRAELYDAWKEELADHEAEPCDAPWAAEATPIFEEDLEELSQGAFRTLDVRCRTTTCSASVEFPSFHDATEGFSSLLHHPYRVNCGTKTVLEEPANPDAAYVATVLYDCRHTREQGLLAQR